MSVKEGMPRPKTYTHCEISSNGLIPDPKQLMNAWL
jgi:hypothetical protein